MVTWTSSTNQIAGFLKQFFLSTNCIQFFERTKNVNFKIKVSIYLLKKTKINYLHTMNLMTILSLCMLFKWAAIFFVFNIFIWRILLISSYIKLLFFNSILPKTLLLWFSKIFRLYLQMILINMVLFPPNLSNILYISHLTYWFAKISIWLSVNFEIFFTLPEKKRLIVLTLRLLEHALKEYRPTIRLSLNVQWIQYQFSDN